MLAEERPRLVAAGECHDRPGLLESQLGIPQLEILVIVARQDHHPGSRERLWRRGEQRRRKAGGGVGRVALGHRADSQERGRWTENYPAVAPADSPPP